MLICAGMVSSALISCRQLQGTLMSNHMNLFLFNYFLNDLSVNDVPPGCMLLILFVCLFIIYMLSTG